MTKHVKAVAAAAVVAGLFAAGPAAALPSYIFDTGKGSSEDTTLMNPGRYVVGRFTVAQSWTLTSVEMFLSYGGTDDVIDIGLFAADGGGVGDVGDLLYSTSFNFVERDVTSWWDGVGGLSWDIDAGSYWIGFKTNVRNLNMSTAAETPLPTYAYGTPGSWTDVGTRSPIVMRAEGVAEASSVPAPAAAWLLLTGAGALVATRRRKRS